MSVPRLQGIDFEHHLGRAVIMLGIPCVLSRTKPVANGPPSSHKFPHLPPCKTSQLQQHFRPPLQHPYMLDPTRRHGFAHQPGWLGLCLSTPRPPRTGTDSLSLVMPCP